MDGLLDLSATWEKSHEQGGLIHAVPEKTVGHWYMIAASTATLKFDRAERCAQILIAEPRNGMQRAMFQCQILGRTLHYAGRIVEEHCGLGTYTWKGTVWAVPTPRSHWVVTRSEDGDIICLQNAGAVAMRGGLVVLARLGVRAEDAVAALPRLAKSLGIPGTARDLFFAPPPSNEMIADTSARWARMGQAAFTE